MTGRRAARALVRLASFAVPAATREEWREEFSAELDALVGRGARGGPVLRFAWGALPAALAERTRSASWAGTGQDLRLGVRTLVRAPVFAAAAVGTLALGIGANTALFAVVDGVLFRPVPGVRDPGGVVQIGRGRAGADAFESWSWRAFELLEEGTGRVFERVAGYQRYRAVLGEGPAAASVGVQLVTGGFFEALGVRPALGRLLRDGDVEEGAAPAAVLSHAAWTSRFGGDPAAVGRTVRLAGEPYEVVGVAPEGFVGVEKVGTPPAVWVPATRWSALRGHPAETPFEQPDWSWLQVVARLRPGVTPEDARGALASLIAARREALPGYFEELVPAVEPGVGLDPEGRREGRAIAGLLAGVGALVLLVACANVANLLLSRALERRHELGVRLSLGAGRARLFRQLLAESAVLGAAGVLAALPFAWGGEVLRPLLFPGEAGVDLSPDGSAFAFAAAAGAASLVLFGVLPALAVSGPGATASALRTARGGDGAGRLRASLVVVQLALCLGLLTGAGMLLRSLWNARTADPGFDAVGLLAVDVDFGHLERYRGADPRDVLEPVRRSLLDRTEVAAASWTGTVPMADFQASGTVRAGAAPGAEEDGVAADVVVVGPRYFSTLGIDLVRGREPDADDVAADVPSAVLSRSLAERLWPDPAVEPLGRTVERHGSFQVVGIAEDVRLRGVRAPARPTLWVTREGGPVALRRAALLVRTRGGPLSAALAVRQVVTAVDPALATTRSLDVGSGLVDSLGETRTVGWLVAILAGLALVLAAVGLFGVLASAVARRRREMGIRTALGAAPGALVGMVVRGSLSLTAVGIVLGLGVSWAVARALRTLLYQVEPGDPAVTLATAALLVAVAGLAAWIPARRAARADPVACLRAE